MKLEDLVCLRWTSQNHYEKIFLQRKRGFLERTQDQGISEGPRQEKALVERERELSRRAGHREHTPAKCPTGTRPQDPSSPGRKLTHS